jgi:hypothetical protein
VRRDGEVELVVAGESAEDVAAAEFVPVHLAGDCTLDNARDTITLARNDSSAVWYEISRSNNDT